MSTLPQSRRSECEPILSRNARSSSEADVAYERARRLLARETRVSSCAARAFLDHGQYWVPEDCFPASWTSCRARTASPMRRCSGASLRRRCGPTSTALARRPARRGSGTTTSATRRLSLWRRAGVDGATAAQRAGHARASMTLDTYSHVLVDGREVDRAAALA
jgi:hypothetical protein